MGRTRHVMLRQDGELVWKVYDSHTLVGGSEYVIPSENQVLPCYLCDSNLDFGGL